VREVKDAAEKELVSGTLAVAAYPPYAELSGAPQQNVKIPVFVAEP